MFLSNLYLKIKIQRVFYEAWKTMLCYLIAVVMNILKESVVPKEYRTMMDKIRGIEET